MRRTVEDLSRVVRTLQRQENAADRREALDGDRDPFGSPEGSLEDEEHTDFREDFNPFHGHDFTEEQERGIGLEERLVRALDLNGAGIKIEVADFFGQMHAEDYLDWGASLETYFEWKPIVEERRILFVKLKLKGAALQWWKRIEEQRSRQGKQKISTWEHMKTKLRKQFLPADYAMELYEKFHSLKQRSLNQAIRDEIGFARLFSLEDAQQYALMAEKRVLRYGGRKPMVGHSRINLQRATNVVPAARSDPTSLRTDRGAINTNQTPRKDTSRALKDEKGNGIVRFGTPNSPNRSHKGAENQMWG